ALDQKRVCANYSVSEKHSPKIKAFKMNSATVAALNPEKQLKAASKPPPVEIAVVGVSGSGKSSFVNALRGFNDGDPGAAEVGTTETTQEPTAYKHPKLPNVILWDLPGMGSSKFPVGECVKLITRNNYDFFIIVSSGCFTENEDFLVTALTQMGKEFIFVRSKMDKDVNLYKRRNKSEEEALEDVRNYCREKLERAGVKLPAPFLISCWDTKYYDFIFNLLQSRLCLVKCNQQQKNKEIASTPNKLGSCLKKKKKKIQLIVIESLFPSFVLGAVPLPVADMAVQTRIVER
uniref:IRG-type G domain-containing protein n=1 Tax=Latimeria chalumnae TaxID=7897 RepID=H3ABH9_LATCH